ncbi:MAG TPA: WD40 repeat domain-containing protein, partial [Kofleriaceae bacterium]|nr:WD40 repeat domain-containing protein [Kofleriaceae bacterium]
ALRLSADGRRAIFEFTDGPPELWDVGQRARLATFAGATHALPSQDGARVLVWRDGEPAVVAGGATLATTGPYEVVGFAHGGTRVVLRETSQEGAIVSLWDITGRRLAARRDKSTTSRLDASQQWLTTIDTDNTVTVWSTRDGQVHATFLAERLLHAVADPQGTFVAAIAEHGHVALLLSASDGRILARWLLDHAPPAITESQGLGSSSSTVTWTLDGSSVVTRAGSVGVWRVANPFTPAQMADRIRRNVPWVVEDGRLAWRRDGKLHGVVLRGGAPQRVTIRVELRLPPEMGGAAINWQSSKSRLVTHEIRTSDDGEFSLGKLPAGEYRLSVGDYSVTKYVGVGDEPFVMELP